MVVFKTWLLAKGYCKKIMNNKGDDVWLNRQKESSKDFTSLSNAKFNTEPLGLLIEHYLKI